MSNSIIEINNLTISFGTSKVVKDVSFGIQKGECMGLVGESGSGKSMTSLAIMQLLPHGALVGKNSQILFKGNDLLTYPERKMRYIRGNQISMIFQDAMSALNPVFTIGNQLREVLRLHKKLSRKSAKKNALKLLDEVGIVNPEDCYRAYPHELSGGMRQRAMIAMSLSTEPKLLIADEPTTALDVTIQAQVLDLLNELKKKHHMTLLFISHDLAIVSKLADEICVLQRGSKVEQASVQQFFQAPKHDYSKKLLAAIPSNTARKSIKEVSKILLEVKDLTVSFPIRSNLLRRTIGHVKAVNAINFEIGSGQTLALVGESGSGKTTSGKTVLKLLQKTSGKIYFNGIDISTLSYRATRMLRQNMQIIFQDPYTALNPRMMIADCIAEGLTAQKRVRNRQEALTRVDHLLEQVGLEREVKWRYPHEFSGGERQRICIARALALEPKLLILDEPTSALDVSIQMQILQLLDNLQNTLNLSYLLITHNFSVVAYMADFVAVMYRGKIIEQGPTEAMLTQPQHTYTKQLLASVPTIKIKQQTEVIA